MELRPSYKQTDVGLIPEDWGVVKFDDVFKRESARNHQIASGHCQVEGSLPVVDQGQELIVGFTDRETLRFTPPKGGAVVFGDHTCVIKFIDFDFVIGADGTQLLTQREGHVARFHAFDLEWRGILSTGYNRHFKLLKERIFTAPSMEEQFAIATVLSDMDALLAAQDALIAKKRAIKRGAMHELLTGKRRLPGFAGTNKFHFTEIGKVPEDWGLAKLEDLVDSSRHIRYGIVQPGKYDSAGRYMIRGQDYSAVNGWASPEEVFRVSDSVERRYKNARVRDGDLIMTIVGYCGHVEQIPGWLNGANLTQTTARISIDNSLASSSFCKYMLQSSYGARQVSENLKGAAQPGLNIRDVKKFLIPLPSIEEQEAISRTLREIDGEIFNLQAQRAKTAQLRQGMMQELLTGRIRLV